jgi:hypothetical protein
MFEAIQPAKVAEIIDSLRRISEEFKEVDASSEKQPQRA